METTNNQTSGLIHEENMFNLKQSDIKFAVQNTIKTYNFDTDEQKETCIKFAFEVLKQLGLKYTDIVRILNS